MSPAPSVRTPQLRELGEFLRARRGAIDPGELGIDTGSAYRRVSGLRREEVASLANISSDYYTRVEQGRLAPSPPVLAALARALRLDDDQTEYATSLLDHATHAAPAPAPAPARARGDRSSARPQLQNLLAQLTETPAIILGPRTDILAWNRLAERLYTVQFSTLPKRELNYVRLMFTEPRMRDLFADWPSVARSCIAILRREAVASPDDAALSSLVGELTIADRDFGRWWAARNVARQDFGTKVLRHPEAGELTIDWDIFRYASAPEQQLVLNSAHPDTPTEQRLRLLHDREGAGTFLR